MATPIDTNVSFDGNGRLDFDAARQSIDQVIALFKKSPEFQSLARSIDTPQAVLHYAAEYLGRPLSEICEVIFDRVLFELIPGTVMIEADEIPVMIAELRAFWTWLDREFALPTARECFLVLDDHAEETLITALADDSNYSLGKRLLVYGKEAGYDIKSDDGVQELLRDFRSDIKKSIESDPPDAKSDDDYYDDDDDDET